MNFQKCEESIKKYIYKWLFMAIADPHV